MVDGDDGPFGERTPTVSIYWEWIDLDVSFEQSKAFTA